MKPPTLSPTRTLNACANVRWMSNAPAAQRIAKLSQSHGSGATVQAMISVRIVANARIPSRKPRYASAKREPGFGPRPSRTRTTRAIAIASSNPPSAAIAVKIQRGSSPVKASPREARESNPRVEPAVDELGAEDLRAALPGAPPEVLHAQEIAAARPEDRVEHVPMTWARYAWPKRSPRTAA